MKTTRRLTAIVIALTATMAIPTAAMAQTEESTEIPARASLDQLKERAQEAIARRLDRIDRLEIAVTTSPYVTDAHEGALTEELARSAAGLGALSGQIEAAQTLDELRPLVNAIAEDYRIYVLVTPKVREVIAADWLGEAADVLNVIGDDLGDWIDRAAASGVDVSEAQRHHAEMIAHIDEGRRLAGATAESVLPLTPADWPDPAQDMLRDGRESLGEARRALRDARESAWLVVRELREAIGSGDLAA